MAEGLFRGCPRFVSCETTAFAKQPSPRKDYNKLSILRLRSDAYSENNALTPAVAAGAAAGTSPTAKSITGRDEFGAAGITAGTSPTTGTLFTVTFAKPYTIAPDAVIVNDDGGLGAYATATTTALTISVHTAPTASTAYKVNYLVVGGS